MEDFNIPVAVDRLLESRQKSFPCHTNRSSSIGDDCLRRLVYERTNWQNKTAVDIGLEYAFLIGNVVEEPIVRLVKDAGYQIERQQEPFVAKGRDGETLLTGHIDGVIRKGDFQAVLEVKTMSPYIWDQTKTAEDFQRHPWTRKYSPQLNTYCIGLEIPDGLWILVNKSSGRLKQIPWKIDYEMGEQMMKRAEEINRHVKENTIPEFRITWPAEECQRCAFFALCAPPLERIPAELIVDELLVKDVSGMMELQTAADKFNSLKSGLKEKLEGMKIKKAFVGDWQYDGTKRNWADRWKKLEGK